VQVEVEVEDSQVHKREHFQVHKRDDSQVHKRVPCLKYIIIHNKLGVIPYPKKNNRFFHDIAHLAGRLEVFLTQNSKIEAAITKQTIHKKHQKTL